MVLVKFGSAIFTIVPKFGPIILNTTFVNFTGISPEFNITSTQSENNNPFYWHYIISWGQGNDIMSK
jgi:hypothetical protein